jgi:hypothetical protein
MHEVARYGVAENGLIYQGQGTNKLNQQEQTLVGS